MLDRPNLEELCCECYAVVKKESDRLLAPRRRYCFEVSPVDPHDDRDQDVQGTGLPVCVDNVDINGLLPLNRSFARAEACN